MSRKFLYFYCCAFSIVLMSCKKDSATGNTLASLTIVNAINGSNAIVTNFSLSNTKGNEQESFQYGLANQISDGSSFEIGSYVGITPLTISLITDTLGALWEGNLDLTAGTSNSFFLAGDTTHVDTLFARDVVPYYPYTGDSVSGVRFVNLIEFSQPITINVQGNLPSQTEFSGVSYKTATNFKAYMTSSSLPGYYTFEIRDQATEGLLAVYQCYYTVFRSQTIVLTGSAEMNGNYPISAFQYNDF